uniref:Uncharacterized protein n=1 Tax=Acrobeloides nanus TaxID=290746 RepID=A0A914C242_9BILA
MLIAMMTNTYTDISANSLEWLRQWSAIIMMMEQSFDSQTRLKYQQAYSIPMEDRKRIALLLKLRVPDDEMEIQKKKLQQSRNTFLDEKRRNFRGIGTIKYFRKRYEWEG